MIESKATCEQKSNVISIAKGWATAFKRLGIEDMDIQYLSSYGAISECIQKFKCKECTLIPMEDPDITLHLPKGTYKEMLGNDQLILETILLAFMLRIKNEGPKITPGDILRDLITTFDKKSSKSFGFKENSEGISSTFEQSEKK